MYTTSYYFNVDVLLSKGHKVMCLDMENDKVFCLNEMMVNTFFELMAKAKADDSRYIFYYKVEGENK